MSVNDFQILKSPGSTRTYLTDDLATSSMTATLKPGDMAQIGGAGSNFVIGMLSGEPSGAGNVIVGIVRKEGTETTSADGTVEVSNILPMSTVIRGNMTTASNITTAAALLAITNDYVTLDVAGVIGSDTTINEDQGHAPLSQHIVILTGNIVDGTLDVVIGARSTLAAQPGIST